MTDTSLGAARFAVVDLETTGLRPHRHHILQMAVVTVDAVGTVLDEWCTYARPPRYPLVWVGARRIHHIGRSSLRGAPPLRTVLEELARRLDGAVITAHNAAFDMAFLRRQAGRLGVALPSGPQVCTLSLSRSLDPDRTRSHRLGDVARRYGVAHQGRHDALDDARATGAVLPHLLHEAGITSLEELLAAAGPTSRQPARR